MRSVGMYASTYINGPVPQYSSSRNKEKIQKVKIENKLQAETSILKRGKPQHVLNQTFQTASTYIQQAKVKINCKKRLAC